LTREWRVPEQLGGERLDSALAQLADGLSRRSARKLIEQGSVYLDGKRVRTQSRPVSEGSLLTLAADEVAPLAPPGSVRVLWEQGAILVLNKPPLVPLVPTREAAAGCLLHALARERKVPLSSVRPVHRLDTPTSGAVLVALDGESSAFLSAALQARQIRKVYLAWVFGLPEPAEGAWDWPLSRGSGGVVRVKADGRPAQTVYRVLEAKENSALLELEPLTGRMHQLRVHCAKAGHPILGDRKYGMPVPGVARGLLHSFRLTFPLPGGSREITVEAPLPEDMRDPPSHLEPGGPMV
jgi:23S rRNA pseudouridine1911/1915/1917 synthase